MSVAAPQPIYKGQDFYVPAFQVKVGDRPLTREVIHDITRVSYTDNIDQMDSFEITISNWDAEDRTFKYSDQQLFDPGKRVELWMGYFGQLRRMLTGEITSLRPTFPSGGQPTLSISGLNLLHRLRTKQVSKSYPKMTDSQIAQQIAGRLAVQIQLDKESANETPYDYVLQHNQYDIVFLKERARRIGYDLFVVEPDDTGQASPSKIYFGRSENVKRVTYELVYGRSMIEFQPNLTTANQVGKVTVRAWDAVNKQTIEGTAQRSSLPNRGVGDAGGEAQIEASFSQREEIVSNTPVHSKAEADTLAKETLDRIAKDMIKGSGSTVGLPDLRAGGVLEISGLGKRFSGRYFVTGTTHEIGDSGYTTRFDCRREEL